MTNPQTDSEAYNRDGFLVVRGAVKGAELKQLERELTKREYDELGNLAPNIGWGAPAPKVEWT